MPGPEGWGATPHGGSSISFGSEAGVARKLGGAGGVGLWQLAGLRRRRVPCSQLLDHRVRGRHQGLSWFPDSGGVYFPGQACVGVQRAASVSLLWGSCGGVCILGQCKGVVTQGLYSLGARALLVVWGKRAGIRTMPVRRGPRAGARVWVWVCACAGAPSR